MSNVSSFKAKEAREVSLHLMEAGVFGWKHKQS